MAGGGRRAVAGAGGGGTWRRRVLCKGGCWTLQPALGLRLQRQAGRPPRPPRTLGAVPEQPRRQAAQRVGDAQHDLGEAPGGQAQGWRLLVTEVVGGNGTGRRTASCTAQQRYWARCAGRAAGAQQASRRTWAARAAGARAAGGPAPRCRSRGQSPPALSRPASRAAPPARGRGRDPGVTPAAVRQARCAPRQRQACMHACRQAGRQAGPAPGPRRRAVPAPAP